MKSPGDPIQPDDAQDRVSDEHRELLANVIAVDVPDAPCSSCVPTVVDTTVTHTDDCPVSLDVETICEGDRKWFASNPATDFFYRPVSWGEATQLLEVMSQPQQFRRLGGKLSAHGRVRVERLTDGARVRRFDDVYFVFDPAD